MLGRIVSAVGLIAAQVGLIVMRHRAETMGDETAGWSGWLADCVELVGMVSCSLRLVESAITGIYDVVHPIIIIIIIVIVLVNI